MGFSSQDYWSGVPFPSLGDLYDPGIKTIFPTMAGGFFTATRVDLERIILSEVSQTKTNIV